jgi:DNA repair exonuclease SbcCD ATPase subunit
MWRRNEMDELKTVLNDYLSAAADSSQIDEHRKQLVEQTRSVRQATDEDKLKLFGSLIKMYQQHIDLLKKRNESADQTMSSLKPIVDLASQRETLATSEISLKDAETARLRAQNSTLTSRIAAAEERCQRLHTELAHSSTENADLNRSVVALRDELRDVQTAKASLADVTAKLEQLETENRQQSVELEQLRSNARLHQRRNEELATDDADASVPATPLATPAIVARVRATTDEIDAGGVRKLDLFDDAERERVAKLEIDLAAAREELATRTSQLAQLQDAHKLALTAANERATSLESELSATSAKLSTFEQVHVSQCVQAMTPHVIECSDAGSRDITVERGAK